MNDTAKIFKRLSELALGEEAEVTGFISDSPVSQRIEEMGVTPGEKIEIVRYAPLGDPIEIKIRGYLLSLRREEADLIKVSCSE